MSKHLIRQHPPYLGNEPYLYLCFADADARLAGELIGAMQRRGCRVWYSVGRTADARESNLRTERIQGAQLVVLMLSPSAARDDTVRANIGYYQEAGRAAVALELSGADDDGGLAMLLHDGIRRMDAGAAASGDELLSLIMHAEGFSQELIGMPVQHVSDALKRATIAVLLTAALAIGGVLVYANSRNWFRPDPAAADTVTLSDEVLTQAARNALSEDGSVPLTEETIGSITTLRLDAAPASFDALTAFPSLETLEIPQSAAAAAQTLLDTATYRIVVYGEADQ